VAVVDAHRPASHREVPGWLRKFRDLLASQNAMAVAALVAVAALGLALYVVIAQINLTNCLARYNEASARSTQARAQAAAEDRATDLQQRGLDDSDRQRQTLNDAALDRVLAAMARQATGDASKSDVEDSFTSLVDVRNASSAVKSDNDLKRAQLAAQRTITDQRRKANPVPDPPSTMCGGKAHLAEAALIPFTWRPS
jgi:hypothetical protein